MRTLVKTARFGGWGSWLVPVAVAAVAALAAGCDWGNKRDDNPPPVVSRIADVPVPYGFKLDAKASSDEAAGAVRRVSHLYKGGLGSLNLAETTDWYRQSMPAHGWQPAREEFKNATQRFVYDKGDETCYVSIWDDWGTKVLIQVFPKGSQPLPTTSGPKP
jgi:hypothetical protein